MTALLGIAAIAGLYLVINEYREGSEKLPTNDKQMSSEYKVDINPKDFTTNITNPYFSLPVGKKLVFEGQTEDGFERIEITIPGDTREIMGVKTIVYKDIVKIDGVLVEETLDYLAQDKEGNVWYFGEEVDNYVDGKLNDHAGSFIAGVDGALPGIWLKGKNVVGDSYRQEYYKGEAEDIRDVVETGLALSTKVGDFNDCIKLYDWTPLDPKSKEHKYYCKGVAALVISEHLVKNTKMELVKTN